MAKRRKRSEARSGPAAWGSVAHSAQGTLRCYTVGALPILNHFLRRMKLEEFFRDYLPAEDPRSKLSPAKGLLVLWRNLLVSREPVYGVGEWAARHAPHLLGLSREEVGLLNDDRLGRELDLLFFAEIPSLALAAVTHIVREFALALEELHNDSTTVTFSGASSTTRSPLGFRCRSCPSNRRPTAKPRPAVRARP